MYYATLTQVRRYLQLASAETNDDALLTEFIRHACRYCDSRAGTSFQPVLEVRRFNVPASGLLQFDDHLLQLLALTNEDGQSIDLADVETLPLNGTPKFALSVVNASGVVSVSGVWGYHDDYARAWVTSGDAVGNVGGISAAATSITVTNANASASDLQSPRFQAGQLIKIDDEYLDVLSVTATTLTVQRGVNGTTAAAHDAAAPISIWRAMDNVVMAVLRLTAWRYRQKDANVFDTTTILGTGIRITPGAVPPDVEVLIPSPTHLVYDD